MTPRRKPLSAEDVFGMLDGRGTTWLCEQLYREFDISNYKHGLRPPEPQLLEAIKTILSPAAAAQRLKRSRTHKKAINDDNNKEESTTGSQAVEEPGQ